MSENFLSLITWVYISGSQKSGIRAKSEKKIIVEKNHTQYNMYRIDQVVRWLSHKLFQSGYGT